MPQVVAAVAAFAGSTALAAGASAATAMVVANTVGWLMTYVVPTFLVSTISRAIQKRPTLPSLKALGMEVNVRDAAAPRSIIYGQRRVSGVLYPVGTSGTNNEYLHLLVLIAGHEVEDLGAVYFNDEEVPLDGSGNATGKYAGYARVKKHLGTYNQTVDTDLQTDLGSGTWSNNHKLAGIAYLYIRLKQSPDLFAGIPEFYCLVKGRKVFDPRDGTQVAGTYSTWKWSSNAALCLADWVRGVPTLNGSGTLVRNYGVGASDAEMDYTSLTTAANICDETVALSTSLTKTCDVASGNRHIGCANVSGIVPGLKVAGTGIPTGTTVVSVDESGTFFTVDRDPTATNNGVTLTIGASESRYQAHGTLASSVRAGDGIDALKSAMAGDCVYVGGQWLILAGAYRTPTVTLTESDLRASLTGVRLKPTRREIVNVVKGVFVSPANAWQPSDFPPVRNATYKTQDGGEDLPADIELPFTTSSSCAQRLAKIMLERSRQGIAFTAKCKLTAMQVQVGDVVRFTNARFGWSAKPFEVLGFSFNAENDPSGAPYLGVDLTLKETASGVWDWNSGEETTIDLAPNTDLPDAFTVPTPSTPTLASGSTNAYQQADGTITPRLKVSWTAPADINVTNGGFVRIEYKPTAGATWFEWATVRGDVVEDYILDIRVGVSFDVRLRFINSLGVRSAYSSTATHTVTGDTAALSAPTGLVAVTGTGKSVSLDWDDVTDTRLGEYAVYRHTSNVPASATKVAEVRASRFVDVDVTIGTAYWYWVTAITRSEVESPKSSGVSATPGVIGSSAVDSTAPDTPSAPTYVSETTYLAGDGSTFARITIAAPALPTGAVALNILYRRSGASDWIIGNQVTAAGNVSIDDLTPGVAYEFAARGISFSGALSVISSTLSRTAPNNSTAPAAPSSATISTDGVKPKYLPGTQVFLFGTRVGWAKNTESDLSHYEVKATTTDSDGATDYSWTAYDGANFFVTTRDTECFLYSASAGAGYVRVRAVNRSGVASSWTRIGNANSAASIGTGTVAKYNTSDVTVTGLKTGGGTSTRQVNVVFTDSVVVTLTGGALTESFNVSLSNRGFSAKPDSGLAQCSNDANIVAAYDYDAAGNSSTNAVVRITTLDGGNLPSGLHRFHVRFEDYT